MMVAHCGLLQAQLLCGEYVVEGPFLITPGLSVYC